MLSFRKVFLALAALLVMSTAAMAQFDPPLSCTAQAAGTPALRDNGVTELVGDVLILCTGGRPRSENEVLPQVNIQVFTQPVVNITSRILNDPSSGNWSEALLFIDEPLPAAQTICGSTAAPDSAPPGSGQFVQVGVCGAHVGTGNPGYLVGANPNYYGTGLGTYAGGAGPGFAPGTFPLGTAGCTVGTASPTCVNTYRPNTFQGRYAPAFGSFDNSLVWSGVPIDPPGTATTRVFRITNVRVNASQLNNPRGGNTPITLSVSTSASGVLNPIAMPITNPNPTVGIAQTALDFSAVDADTFLQCVSQNYRNASSERFATTPSDSLQPQNSDGTQADQFYLRFQERFPTALRRRSQAPNVDNNTPGDPTTVDQSTLGLPYQTETGHYKPGGGSSWNFSGSTRGGSLTSSSSGAGVANTGSRLLVRMSNLPNGARFWLAARPILYQVGGSTSLPTGVARATNANAAGEGSFSAIDPGSTSNTVSGSTRYASRHAGGSIAWVELIPTSGSGYMTYEVLNTDTTVFERVEIPVVVAYVANTSANLPTYGTAKADGQLAPLSSAPRASKTATIPRFTEDVANNGKNTFTINACVSNLLFPFVTNIGGFDTGLAIANTSKDPWGTAIQTGACTINFYGLLGSTKVCLQHPSPSIAGGEHFVWSLANGGAVKETPTFQGYVIAQCNFQYGHGFAFVSDLGATKLAMGYLALVMDESVGTRTGSRSETLGH